ncbi:helix-turn-helix transcriptional regulator [Homoserinimonas sp. OAct 916]|uniref:helix-turn-helix domain-containing protein n=1 Tax=Homoserinimonas sp. OAct 916 TaxID=2211450 RepID=UPI000DBEAADB|nr:helix-turn-helix transcriptional regulator [Homoserinimonas sp. OAct 916]
MSPRPRRLPPAQLGVGWPDTPFEDPVGEVARQFALNVRDAIGGRTIRDVARETGVDRTVISMLMNGKSWPDMVTIANLELGLGRKLWPHPPTAE